MFDPGVDNTLSDRREPQHRRKWLGTGARRLPALAAGALLVAAALTGASDANAAIVPTINLETASDYSVLAGTTVTNTGPSILGQNLGVSPGSAIVGFLPGIVLGATHAADAEALQAQSDLTVAYVDAANRPINATTTADLGGLTLVGGVYAGPSNGPLSLTGPLVLDAQGDPNTVFIFQTGSTLITESSSTVSLINGAQECNVFWQVGSSATLGTNSTFRGNIMALTSISVTTGVTIGGRALARNGAVTLDTNVFTTPTCDLSAPTTTTAAPSSTSTVAPATTQAPPTTVPGPATPGSGTPGAPGSGTPGAPGSGTPGAPGAVPYGGELPATGRATTALPSIAALVLLAGMGIAFAARRPHPRSR